MKRAYGTGMVGYHAIHLFLLLMNLQRPLINHVSQKTCISSNSHQKEFQVKGKLNVKLEIALFKPSIPSDHQGLQSTFLLGTSETPGTSIMCRSRASYVSTDSIQSFFSLFVYSFDVIFL